MANNLDVLDAAAATKTLKTTDTAGVHTPHHNVDSSALPAGAATSANQDTQITAEQAILAKLLAAPATEAKQDTQIAVLGAAADEAVVTDTTGTLSGKLRGLVKWAFERMPAALGQTTKTASLPVVLPSDYQAPILPTNTTLAWTNIGANNTDGVAATDVSSYRFLTLQLTGTWSATISVQFSADGGTTWVTAYGWNTNSGVMAATATANGIYAYSIPAGVQTRIRTTTYASGSVVGNVALSSLPGVFNGATQIANTAGLVVTVRNPADGIGAGTPSSLDAMSYGMIWNGSTTSPTFDRERSNSAVTVLASAARTATVSTDVITYNAATFRIILNITAAPNTASTLTVAIRVKDSISANYVTILTAAAITGSVITGTVPNTTSLAAGAGLVATANVSAPEALARTMNVLVTHSNGDSWTYSISVELGV